MKLKYNPRQFDLCLTMTEKMDNQDERDNRIYELSTLAAGEFSLQEVLDKLAEAAVKITGVKPVR